jgi:hypothetical protein
MLRRFALSAAISLVPACGGDETGGPMALADTSASTDGDDDDDDANDDDDDDTNDDGLESSTAGTTTTSIATSSSGDDGTDASTGDGTALDPPAGGSSGGSGGGAASGDVRMTPDGITYRMIAPGEMGPLPLMIVISGTEGGATMTNNLLMVAGFTGTDAFAFAVLDGVQYNGNGDAGVSVLDDVRTDYDVDNDRTYLLSESAGTTAGLELGLQLRPSYFAAYWANDVNASAVPALDAAALGFAPFGNAGPGGAFAHADAIVAGMEAAGYRTPEPSPYDGPGAGTHGDTMQFLAALQWFPGKTRQ